MDDKYAIWGAGIIGRRLVTFLGKENVACFIDNAPDKIGTDYVGLPVINFDDFKYNYRECIVVIATFAGNESIVRQLEDEGIGHYYDSNNGPDTFYDYDKEYLVDMVKSGIENAPKRSVIYGFDLLSKLIFDAYPQILNQFEIVLEPMGINRQKYIQLNYNADYTTIENVKYNNAVLSWINEGFTEEIKKQGISVNYLFNPSVNQLSFYNSKVADFKDSAKTDTCFIVATGPSLRIEDLDVLHKHKVPCFSVNGIFYAYDKTEWRPTYWICTDTVPFIGWGHDPADVEAKYRFISDNSPEYISRKLPENMFVMHPFYASNVIKFSEDLARGYYSSETVTFVCIQMAVYMGYKTIYLLGVDHSMGMPGPEHFVNDYLVEGEVTPDEAMTREECVNVEAQGYKVARQYADSHGIKIFNSTRGGYLEAFERIDFDSIFTRETNES